MSQPDVDSQQEHFNREDDDAPLRREPEGGEESFETRPLSINEVMRADPHTPVPNRRVPVLTVLMTGDHPREVIVDKPELIIGRAMNCDIIIPRPNTSREHARIVYENYYSNDPEPLCFVEDLKSRNGTFLNKEKLDGPAPLNHGDTVLAGDAIVGYFVREEWEVNIRARFNTQLAKHKGGALSHRVPCKIAATMRILIPQETFTPKVVTGTIEDLDATGLRFISPDISKELWLMLIQKKTYIQCDVTMEGVDKPVVLRGRMAWSHIDTRSEENACVLGIEFSNLAPDARDFLDAQIDRLSELP